MNIHVLLLAFLAFGCGTSIPVLAENDTGPRARDSGVESIDAPGMDAPRDVGAVLFDAALVPDVGVPRECDVLERAAWSGETPVGAATLHVESLYLGDCITISGATLSLRASTGYIMRVTFPYPVRSTPEGRVIEGTFERLANVYWEPAIGSAVTAMVRVDVTGWAEHWEKPTGHVVDATLTFLDGGFGSDPIAIRGRFCDWDSLLC